MTECNYTRGHFPGIHFFSGSRPFSAPPVSSTWDSFTAKGMAGLRQGLGCEHGIGFGGLHARVWAKCTQCVVCNRFFFMCTPLCARVCVCVTARITAERRLAL